MTTREQAIETAKKAGFDEPSGIFISYGASIEAIERLIAIATNAALEQAASVVFGQCSSDNVAQRTADAIRKLKVTE